MKLIVAGMVFFAVAACGGAKNAAFSCLNGPGIAITYDDQSAVVTFANGRSEVVPSDPARAGVYAKPGFSWSETGFRSGRLNDGTRSYSCDQISA